MFQQTSILVYHMLTVALERVPNGGWYERTFTDFRVRIHRMLVPAVCIRNCHFK